jgi:potassium efflux system protein
MVEPVRTLLLSLLFVFATALRGQDPSRPSQDPTELAASALQARLDAVQADTTMAAELKGPLAETLRRAVELATTAEARSQQAERYDALRASAAGRLEKRRADLEAVDRARPGPPRQDLSLAELEQGLVTAQQAQATAMQQAADLEAERARRTERRTALPGQIAEWQAKLEALPTEPQNVDGDPVLVGARRLVLRADRVRHQAELRALTAEQASYEAEAEWLRVESDFTTRRLVAAKADADGWLAVLQPMRAAAAQAAERQARAKALLASPALATLAEGNSKLASEIAELVDRRASAEQDKVERDKSLLSLQQEFDEIKRRVEGVRTTDALATLLRQRRLKLIETSQRHQQRIRSRTDRIGEAQLKAIQFQEDRRRLVEEPERWLLQQLGFDPEQVPTGEAAEVVAAARPLRDTRRDLLQQLADGYENLLFTEVDVENSERQLLSRIASYRAYVTERVLGLRSSPPLWNLDWGSVGRTVAWFVDARRWLPLWETTWQVLVLEAWAALVPLLALLLLRRRILVRLAAHGAIASRGTNVAYRPTALAAIDTLLLAAPLPLLLWLWAARLDQSPDGGDFAKAVAIGARHSALALLLVSTLAQVARRGGLAEAHFQWQSTTVLHLRRAVPLLLLAGLPFTFLLAVQETPVDDAGFGSLGSPLLLAQLGILLVVFARLLHPQRGLVGGGMRSESVLWRFRRLWYVLAIGVPLCFMTMVVLGYEYTVLQFTRRLYVTVGVVVVAVLFHALVLRSLQLMRRRLQMRRAEERLAAARSGGSATELEATDEVDPQLLARQTQALLGGAIALAVAIVTFQVWVDVQPALGILRRVPLWGSGTDEVVTLADLLLGTSVLVLSVLAARNLPALLELLVLQRLKVAVGERNAIATLARYLLFTAGIVVAFQSIGLGWAKVQWLLAAVSVGLGFGLQEIFANFVSGLILLFERPIRVGDVVTVGTTTGRVLRIRIRATTILDWDRKELIVPNREFVTSQFVNWTLGEPLVRWVLPVGVAYGSDTGRALQLLEQAAQQSKFVVRAPAPEAVMVGFGDSTLNLELRIHVDMNQLEYRWMTEIYQGIDKAFREAGIEIAFPQRDVNLKLPSPVAEWFAAARPEPRAS